jgi:hypothetical protein
MKARAFPLLVLGVVLALPLQAQERDFVVGGPYAGGYGCDTLPTINRISWSQSVDGTQQQRLLVVSVITPLDPVVAVARVTYGGKPLTQKAVAINDLVEVGTNATGVRIELWYLLNPDPGTASVVCSLTASIYSAGGLSAQYSNVNQTAPFGPAVTTMSESATSFISSDVPNTVSTAYKRGMVIDFVGLERIPPVGGWDAGPDQIQRASETICGPLIFALSEELSNGGTVTMSGVSNPVVLEYCIAQIAVEVRPASLWISAAEIAALPTSGTAWDTLNAWANQPMNQNGGKPTLSDQNDNDNMVVLAKALRYVRQGNAADRDSVRWACNQIVGTEECYPPENCPTSTKPQCVGVGVCDATTLSVGRELGAYVIALDLVGGPAPADSGAFNSWLRTIAWTNIPCDGCGSLPDAMFSTARRRPNNWGTMNMGSLAAVFSYLGWTGPNSALDSLAWVVEGWTGNRAKHIFAGFNTCTNPPACDNLSCASAPDDCAQTWMPAGAFPDSARPINPVGATIYCEGAYRNVDGALPDDHRRGGAFTWEPCRTGYPWGGLAGIYMAAWILHRQGYPAFEWQNQALKRAVAYQWYLERQFPLFPCPQDEPDCQPWWALQGGREVGGLD